MAAEVEFPQVRERMMAAVSELAKPYTPDPAALVRLPAGLSQFSEIFDVLCEELDLDQIDPREAVGYYLKSEDEGPPLAELASLLQAVWDEAEKYASDPAFPTDDEFQQAPSWPKVVDSARRAHDALLP
jgi:hypothetical protein